MSVVDQLKNLFSKKQPESELDSRLSLAMPDATVNSAEHETLQESQNAPLQAPAPSVADEPVVPEGELISIPILGRRTVVQHQRTLFVLLGGALVVLAGVTFYALNQSDRVAQQLGATGQSLMQSQRLAKSVSQAVVGSAQAFPDVSDSSGILSKSVKGLQSGDDEMRINALNEDFAPELGKVIPLVERADKNAKAVIAQQKMLTQIGSALRLINRQSSDLLEVDRKSVV